MIRIVPVILAAALTMTGAAFANAPESNRAVTNIQMVSSDGAAEAESPEIVEMVMGAEDAPITLIEYASFTCPHCASFQENVFGKLKSNYIDTGKVKFVFRDVYFDRFGL